MDDVVDNVEIKQLVKLERIARFADKGLQRLCGTQAKMTALGERVIGARMLRPWPAEIVEEDSTTIGALIVEDRLAADRAGGIRIDLRCNCIEWLSALAAGDAGAARTPSAVEMNWRGAAIDVTELYLSTTVIAGGHVLLRNRN